MIKRIVYLVLCFAVVTATPTRADDSDDLLLLIPSIIASKGLGSQTTEIRALGGQWKFVYRTKYTDYYRFNPENTSYDNSSLQQSIAVQASSKATFDNVICPSGLSARYLDSNALFVILCDYSGSSNDLGDVFIFASVGAEEFEFTHYYYVPSTGQLKATDSALGQATRVSESYALNSLAANQASTLLASSTLPSRVQISTYTQPLLNNQSIPVSHRKAFADALSVSAQP